ncbi:glycoside hydrolase family 5 protein [Fibrobacter sp. UWH4]|uniref:glycoside hydrolase family 5 protein n=1 Tax=Fibrobacter sp. UWH4 TaxID=1896210 RepID=UPI0009168539|nr:glycoside hydrolase family 5 protein [Fibrobacter sp. UWH4]SHK61841.1 Cellulase (glycosyl hydrolase family 5) [Fibrobacter sp. UWH4]
MFGIGKFGIAVGALSLASTAAFALPKATEIYPDMGLGYNIGNTMEVPGNPTGWGNSFPDAAYVKAIKDAGFNTVRIPCAWNSHASNGTINAGWLDSVKTVVDLVINNGMYAILNSHWDEGWLEDEVFSGGHIDRNGNQATTDSSKVRALQEGYWKQIADYFKTYDEHLIFASANEPGVNDHRGGSAADGYTDNGQLAFNEDRMTILKRLHEACLRAVRTSGGNNATRIVVVQAPRTEIDKVPLLSAQYPTDPAGEGYTMAEIHFYPYQFSLMTSGDESWGKMFYYWEDQTPGNDAAHTCSGSSLGSKSSIDQLFSGLKSTFYDKGIPVVIGEMGAVKRFSLTGDNLKAHLKARAAWYGYTVAAAKKNGLVPCVWDTGDEGDGNMTIIRRQVNKFGGNVGDITDVETLNAMREAFGQAALPGGSIDSLVNQNPDIPEGSGKGVQVTYQTVTSDSSEVGTLRINLASGKNDLSKYVGIEIRLKGSVTSAGPCTNAAKDCGEYGWTSMDLFMMTGSSWAWFDAPVLQQADQELNASKFQTFQVKWDDFRTTPTGLNSVNAIGLNLYGTQVTGTITFDYIKGIKADGSTEIIDDFDKKPQLEGIASAKIVALSGTDAIKPAAVAATSKMFVNVQYGSVMAQFNAAATAPAKAMLLNSMGQVIAQQNFTASKGMNTVELSSDYRGPAVLMVKQGSQRYMQKVILK